MRGGRDVSQWSSATACDEKDPCSSISDWRAQVGRVDLLSAREMDVFRLLGAGCSNRVISARLQVTERTVKAHVAHILAKLEVESRLQAGLVSYAYHHERVTACPLLSLDLPSRFGR
ncbi:MULTISPECIES: helix-turn-helix transcriptional regulator [unclassified Streptomyces]|uniref:response regulator transcription factor n=1 Tax=unclassified Streptomyces TaxID=2593676 RepID=UPI0033AC379D